MALQAVPPTTDLVAELHACLDQLSGVEADALGAPGQAAVLDSLSRAESRIAAIS